MKQIIAVCGPVCCGKTTWCNEHMDKSKDSYIKVSDIVKMLSNAQTRAELQNTKDLDKQIATELLKQVDSLFKVSDIVYIDGIRQLSIFEYLKEQHTHIKLVWLEVPYEQREQRYNSRADLRDSDINFIQADLQDFNLGLGEIKDYFHSIQIII
jgi:predicted kinase